MSDFGLTKDAAPNRADMSFRKFPCPRLSTACHRGGFEALRDGQKFNVGPAPYSGHSLRAGLATSAAQAGVPTWEDQKPTRHASEAMLRRARIRSHRRFA